MSAISAATKPVENKKAAKAAKASSKPSSSKFFAVSMQVFVVALAFGASFLIHKSYGEELKLKALEAYENVSKIAFAQSAGNPIKEMIKEMNTLRQQTLNLQRQILSLIEKKKDSDAGVEEDRFYMHQFEEYFRLTPVNDVVVVPELQEKYAKYNLTEDPYYKNNQAECDNLDGEYHQYLTRPSMFDERFYVKWSNERKDYALFARIDIPGKAVLGYFAGELRTRFKNIDDAWRWKGEILGDNGKPLNLVVDSRFKGNWFHFLRIGKKGNVDALLVPDIKNNMWHVLFKSKRPVEAGEELFLSSEDLE